MGRNKKTVYVLAALMILSILPLAGCGAKEASEPGKNADDGARRTALEFFEASFHDGENFTFDGFHMLDSYKSMEERMELTKQEGSAGASEDGADKEVTYPQVTVEGMPDVTASVEYNFHKDQFAGGSMEIDFPSYEEARDYVVEKTEKLAELQSEAARKEQEENGAGDGYSLFETEDETGVGRAYEDGKGVYLLFQASRTAEGGHVRIFYQENLNYTLPGAREKSIYFDFDE